jgi:hypothetical protein
MQNHNWRFVNRAIAVATVTVLVASFTTLAAAQREDDATVRSLFASAQRVQTSVKGVTIFAAPPSGFNPLTATNRELLSYGLPQRPDASADPKALEHWQRGMSALQSCYQHSQPTVAGRSTSTGAQSCRATDVTALSASSLPMVPGHRPVSANADGTTAAGSLNWSGIAQTNKLTKWNNNTSFTEVESVWNLPVANHPFGNIPCSDGPWWEVTWNGIDGFSNGDVVQGGSSSYWDGGGCSGSVQTYAWVEWAPSYSILSINNTANAGDDMWVITYGTAGTAEQTVFVEDITQQWSGTFGLVYQSGPGLVGSSAEYIVERPCCAGSGNYYPLGNYVYEFFDYSFAYDGKGTQFYPGSASAATNIITMEADEAADYQDISRPYYYGTGGNQGKYSIWMADEGCANSGGCAP